LNVARLNCRGPSDEDRPENNVAPPFLTDNPFRGLVEDLALCEDPKLGKASQLRAHGAPTPPHMISDNERGSTLFAVESKADVLFDKFLRNPGEFGGEHRTRVGVRAVRVKTGLLEKWTKSAEIANPQFQHITSISSASSLIVLGAPDDASSRPSWTYAPLSSPPFSGSSPAKSDELNVLIFSRDGFEDIWALRVRSDVKRENEDEQAMKSIKH
jgi:hypothetical protein